MTATRRTLSCRSRAERVAIAALRTGWPSGLPSAGQPEWTPDERQAFVDLAGAMLDEGLRILTPGCRFVSADEIRVAGWIAYRQRSLDPCHGAPAFDAAVTACALLLKTKNIWLPYGAGVVASDEARRRLFVARTDQPSTGAMDKRALVEQLASAAPCRAKVRGRVLAMLADRDIVAMDDFRKAGISRQNISRLCRTGIVVRLGCGLYRTGAELG